MQIQNNYPKYVLSMDAAVMGDDYQGIKRVNLVDFLLDDKPDR